MFGVAVGEIQARTFVCKRLLSVIQSLDSTKSIEASAFKGLIFVHLYGAYEYAINSAVQSALATIRDGALSPFDLHRRLLTLILDAEFKAVTNSGRSRAWRKRLDLVSRFDADNPLLDLDNTLFPSDGSHYRLPQLHTIWEIFGLSAPVVPEPRLQGRVEELVENRNAIAHGRRTPEEVGGRYSTADISKRISDIESISTHIVESMEKHCAAGGLRR